MKRHPLFVVALALATLPACGPGTTPEESGSGSASSSGSMTDPIPQVCDFNGNIYEDGEEFDTPDGCLRYECRDGGLDVLTDNRVTVAGDLDLTTQEEVDQQICLGEVEGTLTISGTAEDLTPLLQLGIVGGSLDIIASNAESLTGLETLREVGGDILIADNESLSAMSFQVFMSVFGDVTIQNNDALTSLDGAEFIGQCSACAGVSNTFDEVGSAPSHDQEPGGGDPIPGGDEGGAQPAEEGDEPQGGVFYGAILIADNDALADITALGNLNFAWDDVRFRNNAILGGLADIPLTEVQGDLEISDHAAMSTANVEAFAAGIDVWGAMTLCGNLDGTACPE